MSNPQTTVPPVPREPLVDKGGRISNQWERWLQQIQRVLSFAGGIGWGIVDKAGSKLTDIEQRTHAMLQDVQAWTSGTDTSKTKHISNADGKFWQDHVELLPDVSVATIHHTLGPGEFQSAAGNHGHAGLTEEQIDRILNPDYSVNPMEYGASGSVEETTGSITSGSGSLTVASAIDFAVGQGIYVAGAGTAGAGLVAAISNINSLTITINPAASTTVTNARVLHDDSDALMAADATMEDRNRGVMLFPNGYYWINKPVTIKNCVLASLTPGRAVDPYLGTSPLGYSFNQSGATFCTTENITMITMDGQGASGVFGLAFVTDNYGEVALDDTVGLVVQGSATYDASGGKLQINDGFVQNCWFGWLGTGLQLDRVQGFIVVNNVVDAFYKYGIKCNRFKSSVLANNIIIDTSYAPCIELDGRSHRNMITGNHIGGVNSTGNGLINIKDASFNVITANLIRGGEYGVKFFGSSNPLHNKVQGNSFISATKNCVYIDGLTLTNVVSGNTFSNETDGLTTSMVTDTSAYIVTNGTCSNLELTDNCFNYTAHTAYSAAATYALYDTCSQGGHNYWCSTAITVPEAFNAAHWTDQGVPKVTAVTLSSGTTATDVSGKVSGLTTILCNDANGGNLVVENNGSAVIMSGGTNQKLLYLQAYTGATTLGPSIRLRQARGLSASATATLSGDVLGNVQFGGYNSTGWNTTKSAGISANATENHTSTGWGSRLNFETVGNGQTGSYPRLEVSSTGKVKMAFESETYTPSQSSAWLAVDGEILPEDGIRFSDGSLQNSAGVTYPTLDAGKFLTNNGSSVSWATVGGGTLPYVSKAAGSNVTLDTGKLNGLAGMSGTITLEQVADEDHVGIWNYHSGDYTITAYSGDVIQGEGSATATTYVIPSNTAVFLRGRTGSAWVMESHTKVSASTQAGILGLIDDASTATMILADSASGATSTKLQINNDHGNPSFKIEGKGFVTLYDETATTPVAVGCWDSTNKKLLIGTTTYAAGTSGAATFTSTEDFPSVIVERSNAYTNATKAVFEVTHKTSDNMADGFGGHINFKVTDSGATGQLLGQIGCARAGADNTGDIFFKPSVAGTANERFRIKSSGEVTINGADAVGDSGITPTGGFYTCYYAKETLAVGQIVYFVQAGTNQHVSKATTGATSTQMPIGVVYEAVTYTADNTNIVKVIWGGRADVLWDSGGTTPAMGMVAYVSSRVGSAAGSFNCANTPSTGDHWAEIGHVTSATAISTNHYWIHLHFN